MVQRTASNAAMSIPSATSRTSSQSSWLGDVFGLNGTSAAHTTTTTTPNSKHHRFSEPTRNRSNTSISQQQQQQQQQLHLQKKERIEWEDSEDTDEGADSPLLRAPSPAKSGGSGTSFDFGGLYGDDGCNLAGNLCLSSSSPHQQHQHSGEYQNNNNDSLIQADLLQKIRLLQDQNASLMAANQALELENATGRQQSLQRSLLFATGDQPTTTTNDETTTTTQIQAFQVELDRLQRELQQQRQQADRSVDETELFVLREELQRLTQALTKERTLFAEFKATTAASPYHHPTSVMPYDMNILAEREATIKELRHQCLAYSQELTQVSEQHDQQISQLNQELEHAVSERTRVDLNLEQLQTDYQTSITELESRLDEWQERAVAAEQRSNQEITVQSLQAALQTSQQGIDQLQKEYLNTKEHHTAEVQTWRDSAQHWEAAASTLEQESGQRLAELQQTIDQLQEQLKSAETESSEANDSIMHMVETVKQLETKYLAIEHQLFETKLQVEAAQEERAALLEDHENQIAEMDESIQRILAEKSDMESDHVDQIRTLEERLETIQKENEDLAQEQAACITELETRVQDMELEKSLLLQNFDLEKQDLQVRLDSVSREKGNDSYDFLRLNALISEVERLERAVQVEKRNGATMLQNLRQELLADKDLEIQAIQREKTQLVQEQEREKQELNRRLESISQEKQKEQRHQPRQLLPMEEKKTDDTSYDSARFNALVAEVDRLERAVQEEKRNGETMLEKLRQELNSVKERERHLAKQVEIQRAEFGKTTRTLQERITDRDERIDEFMTSVDNNNNDGSREYGQVLALKAENNHLQTQLNEMMRTIHYHDNNDGSTTTDNNDETKLIRERDDAIASLVMQTQEQEEIIEELQEQIRDLVSKKVARSLDATSSPKLVKRLEQEAKVFAEQVIELDEEMEQLKAVLSERERQASEMAKQLMEVKQKDTPQTTSLVLDLEAEIEDLKEANKSQLDEIRDLRKKVWTTKSHEDEVAQLRNKMHEVSVEAEDFKRQVDRATESWSETQRLLAEERKARAEIENTLTEKLEKSARESEKRILSLEKQLKDVQKEFEAYKARPSHVTEEECKALQDELLNLKQTVKNLNFELDHSKRTIQELDGMLAEKRADAAAFHEEEKEELLAEMEALSTKLEEARHRISQLQEDESMFEEYKMKLERADDSREEREKSIIDTYERKISLLTLDKDVTNDKLRKELIAEREANTEDIAELNEQLKLHQKEVSQLREALGDNIDQRETRIFELEHTLEAQEQLVQNMKNEMDHLQGSMEGNAARRKGEIEEMQKELLDMTAAAARQEREIESLKGELETSKTNHETEVAKLKKKLVDLEGSREKNRNAQDLQMELRVKEVKDRLEKLKWRNSSLKVENINLKDRLERAETLLKENDQPEKIKNLQTELDSQSRKIKKLETELERAREPPAASRTSGRSRSLSTTRMRPTSRKPPIPQTAPSGSETVVSSSTTQAAPSTPSRMSFFGRLRSRSRDPSSRQPPKSEEAS